MQNFSRIKYIDEVDIKDKRVLLRTDFDVAIQDGSVKEPKRIEEAIPSVKHLLGNNNRLIIMAHLGRPGGEYKSEFSLKPVVEKLKEYLSNEIVLIENPLEIDFSKQSPEQIYVLENMRFWPEEEEMNLESAIAAKLKEIADVFVNDAFASAHRAHLSVVGMTKFMPSYGGLHLKIEIEEISKLLQHPQRPFAAIIGGAKISTKIGLIKKLMEKVDYILIGGGLANTFLAAQGYKLGSSKYEKDEMDIAKQILFAAAQSDCAIYLPSDAILGEIDVEPDNEYVKNIEDVTDDDKMILDIGPETEARFGAVIANSKTIMWNGPVGYFEKADFKRSSDFVYYSIVQNPHAYKIIGGGDTIASLSDKDNIDKINHISTGGGAMLELIEKGSLPALDALINSNSNDT